MEASSASIQKFTHQAVLSWDLLAAGRRAGGGISPDRTARRLLSTLVSLSDIPLGLQQSTTTAPLCRWQACQQVAVCFRLVCRSLSDPL